MAIRASLFVALSAVTGLTFGACANDPQYIDCGTTDAMDLCQLDTANATGSGASSGARGSLHVPVMPLDSDLTKTRAALQATMPAGVMVPMYRDDQYDLSVDYTITNLDSMPGEALVELNGANEMFAWDPSKIMPASDESPPTPGLGGDIPITVPANGSVDGQFTEDNMLEAAIDLDQITRCNLAPYAATLVVNKNDQSIQPLSPEMPPPPGSEDPPMQTPTGSPIPRSAFANIVRVDLVLKQGDPARHMQLTFSLRVRTHVDKVIDDKGMNAPDSEVTILDPAAFVPAFSP